MARQPCIECRERPKWGSRHRCVVCAMRHEPIGEQVAAAQRRASMVPPELQRRVVPERYWPAGTRWCSGCQSFVDLADVAKSSSRCRACSSAVTHAAMIEKTYDLTASQYAGLLATQGGRCAICRARPKSKRLAVDHDHKSGLVRGLLCSRCNHDLMGSAWDSMNMALALWHYMNTPPTAGTWRAPELGLEAPGAQRPVEASVSWDELFATVAVPGARGSTGVAAEPVYVSLLPTGYATKEPAELHAIRRELDGLLARVDPAPF